MEFLDIHLQLALLNSSQRPMKSILKKYPTAICDENAIKSLINATIVNIIERVIPKKENDIGDADFKKKNPMVFESFRHLENYFFSAMWNEVTLVYEEEKAYSFNSIPYNELHGLNNCFNGSSNQNESVEDVVVRADSYEKLCSAIRRLEANELRNRAIRSMKKCAIIKKVKKDSPSEDITWLTRQVSEAESLSTEEFTMIQGYHCLVRNREQLTPMDLDLLSNMRRGNLSEFEFHRLIEAGREDDRSSNLYGFAERFIEEPNIHSSLENGNEDNRKLISGQRNMIRRELGRFRRG